MKAILDQIESLTRSIADPTRFFPMETKESLSDIRIMIQEILDRVYQLKNELYRLEKWR